MKPQRTLVLMADETAARFLVNDGPGKGLRELAGLSASQFPDLQLEYQDRAPRNARPASSARHAVDPRESLETQLRERFARHVAEALEQEWDEAAADRLVVAAGPKMLGILRKLVSGPPAAALAGDLPKDLMNTPLNDLPKHFDGLIKL